MNAVEGDEHRRAALFYLRKGTIQFGNVCNPFLIEALVQPLGPFSRFQKSQNETATYSLKKLA
jgi:hypothetical protein